MWSPLSLACSRRRRGLDTRNGEFPALDDERYNKLTPLEVRLWRVSRERSGDVLNAVG
jgi:hypothetical protein